MSVSCLVILAAGLGTRFGGNKQLSTFGPLNITLMEYNLAHAIDAGFTKVVLVIQEQNLAIIKKQITDKYQQLTIEFAFQSFDELPNNCQIAKNRQKPLGTAHALWCARQYLSESFVVINADDYYGQQAFELATKITPAPAFLIAYPVQNTLSEHGGVNRGLCLCDDEQLQSIEELTQLERLTDKQVKGINSQKETITIPANSLVSMNFWCFSFEIFHYIEQLLNNTFTINSNLDKECYLPNVITLLLKEQHNIRVLTSQDTWFGVTYAADSASVNNALISLVNKGLFSSLAVKNTME